MKPTKKIVLLGSVVTAIILFWLVPGINTAKQAEYTRRYEDVEIRPIKAFVAASMPQLKITPVYKTETIKPEMELSDITPKMYGRGMQFQEVLLDDSLIIEEIMEEEIVDLDSVTAIAVDSVANGI
jgi:hypothetical protein